MGRIHVHEFISLDGRYEDPSFTMPYGFTEAMSELVGGIMADSTSILLGRRTFEMFAPAWSERTVDDDPGAPFFNDTPKFVVSSTLREASGWQNSSVLGPYDADAIGRFKTGAESGSGDIYVSGSGSLVRAMLADGLVDVLHLLVYPVVLGKGERLFDSGTGHDLALVGHDVFDNGVVHLAYGPAA